MTTLKQLISRHNVRAEAAYGGAPYNESFPNSHPWLVTLRMGRRQMSVPFYTGAALTDDPDAEMVLDCLASDAATVENARSFDEWCSELGYDTDSRKAERDYKLTIRQTRRLRRFLAEHAETFIYAERD
jgi:hypothetical protein